MRKRLGMVLDAAARVPVGGVTLGFAIVFGFGGSAAYVAWGWWAVAAWYALGVVMTVLLGSVLAHADLWRKSRR